MIGAKLSPWTMSYFAAALVSLLAGEVLMACGFGFPAAPVAAPDTFALVHLITVGWLSVAMCGALIQFVPVLTAATLYSERTPPFALALLVAGLASLVAGFLQLGGRINSGLPLLTLAAIALGGGFALIVWNLAMTLWKARPLPPTARFVALGLACAGATALLGIAFAIVLEGGPGSPAFVAATLPIHVIAGLGGWLTITAAGVSYRLLSMFMLAPDVDRAHATTTLRLGAAAVSLTIAGGLTAVALHLPLEPVLAISLVVGLLAVALYGRDILTLYHSRKRRTLELNGRMAAVAVANLVIGAALSAGLALAGKLADGAAAIVFLIAFGWLSGLVLAKLYKIVAFLTWLECYGPALGKMPTPRVQDLVSEGPAGRWFVGFFAAVWLATGALLIESGQGFRIGAAGMTLATCAIVAELIKTRRLARLPRGARPMAAPHLLYSSARTP
jgi:hypothetical protein